MEWLRDLLAKIEAFPDGNIESNAPQGAIKKGEKVIGTLPIGLRKLFAYHSSLTDDLNSRQKEHDKGHERPGHTRKECQEFAASVAPLVDEIKVTTVAFWSGVRSEMNITVENIGVRKGWKIVEIQEKKEGIGGLSMLVMQGNPR